MSKIEIPLDTTAFEIIEAVDKWASAPKKSPSSFMEVRKLWTLLSAVRGPDTFLDKHGEVDRRACDELKTSTTARTRKETFPHLLYGLGEVSSKDFNAPEIRNAAMKAYDGNSHFCSHILDALEIIEDHLGTDPK